MPPLIVGHRGAKDVLPENTLVSFERAIADGADLLECDVHLSADGHLVVMHDARIDRTVSADSPRRSGVLAEFTAAELAEVRVGGGRDADGPGQRVPLLEEVLDLAAAAQIPLLLEVKAAAAAAPVARLLLARAAQASRTVIEDPTDLEDGPALQTGDDPAADAEPAPASHALVEVVGAAGGAPRAAGAGSALGSGPGGDRVVVISFLREALESARSIAPRLPVGLITKTPTEDDWAFAEAIGARTFGLTMTNLREHDVIRAHEAGLVLNAWTLNDPDAVAFAAELGVDTFTTDDPAWGRAVLEAMAVEQAALTR
jgi:glycerophosphoryl diester phosphodiesterase